MSSVAAFLELSFDLGALDADTAESTAFDCGAFAVTFVDARDDSPVLEPAPGETPLWPATRVKCLFADAAALGVNAPATVAAALACTCSRACTSFARALSAVAMSA